MNTNHQTPAVLPSRGLGAVADVKALLQHAYPQLAEIIHLVLDEEEAKARALSSPHLLLPDLVAAHIEKLNLEPVRGSHHLSMFGMRHPALRAA